MSRLLFLETGLVGLISLVAGLGLGILASYGLSALTLSMFSMDASQLALHLSGRAVGKTILYFGLIFLLVMVFSGIQVSRAKLIDLIHGDRKNEPLKEHSLKVAVVQLVVGVILLLCAYAMLLMFGMIIVVILPLCIPMLAMGTVGTLLIFRSLSGFVLKLAKDHPKLYYKNLNLFTLRQWISKVHTTYLSQTVICLLLLLAIGITASSVGLNSTLEALTDQQAPFDLTVQNQSGDTQLVDFVAELQAGGVDTDTVLAWQYDVVIYHNTPEITGEENASGSIRISDYNALQTRSGQPTYSGALPYVLGDMNQSLVTGNLGLHCVVIPDDMAQQLSVRRQIWCADYAGDKEIAETTMRHGLAGLPDWATTRVESRVGIYQEVMGSKILALFLGLYLGFTFLLAAAAVLALQQLSQAADNTGRYAILRRLGVQDNQLAHSATQQVVLAFILPLALALIHSVVGMKAANDIINLYGKVDTMQSTVVTTLLLIAVYGGYFLVTAMACRRMAKQKN